ncbi:MAG: galactokinase [Pseudomonadota bacterium]
MGIENFMAGERVETSAPGRVNLLGEHTDYNDGYVLPIAIPLRTRVLGARSTDRHFHVYSANLDECADFDLNDELPDGYARYVAGCIMVLKEQGLEIPPLALEIHSDVPMESGLSSSAALEVAVLRTLRQLLGLKLDDVQIALLAQQAEIRYAGVQSGIMDQMAASLADTQHMLFLDTRTLERRSLPFPQDAELVVIHSGVMRTLANSEYNKRYNECREAARLLGVAALRDITDVAALAGLPALLQKRARHVVTENARVLQAIVPGLDASTFGELMNASHASLKEDYEVSIPALDTLCDLLRAEAGVYGARLTGAGFGGACIALCRRGRATKVAIRVTEHYNRGRLQQLANVLLPAEAA